MQVIFKSRQVEGTALRDEALQRVRLALRRIASVVLRAKVMLSDINGPRGGVDKLCTLEVKTENSGVLVISSLASNWHAALSQGLERLVRVLNRTLHRKHKTVRRLAKPEMETVQ